MPSSNKSKISSTEKIAATNGKTAKGLAATSQPKTIAPKAEARKPESAKPVAPMPPNAAEPSKSILAYTPVSEIPAIVEKITEKHFAEQKTHPLQFRLNQLRNLYFAIKDNIDDLSDALYKDFGRSPTETYTLEYLVFMNELLHTMAHLHQWARPAPVDGLSLVLKQNPVYVEYIPLGVVLVIAPFNYPLLLSLSSVVGALSAGNSVVLKLSELTPHFTAKLTEVLTEALDPSIFAMVNGAIPETQALLDQKFDKIMYTGSTAVGSLIAKKAAETLTPVLLELGGKSPAFVLDDITDKDISTVARRIVWGRFTNSGQTCVAVDYVLVHEKVKEKLVKAIVKVVEEQFYKDLDSTDSSYTHVIHQRGFEGLKNMIESTSGDIRIGGEFDSEARFISPTVIDNVDWSDSTMKREIFGPVLPILLYSDLTSAVRLVTRYHDTPLALYIFTSGAQSRAKNPAVEYIQSNIRSGATMVNDCLMHVSLANAPFGGIGTSGQGAYHGKYSFRAFSHERTIMENKLTMDFALSSRYPPASTKKTNVLEHSMTPYNGSVWFGRTGNVREKGPNLLWSAWKSAMGVGALVYYFFNSM